MRFDIITLFPDVVKSYATASILGRAQEGGLVDVHAHDLREYADGKHNKVDDRPYGGGPGMVLKAEPILKAVNDILEPRTQNLPRQRRGPEALIIVTSPRGKQFDDDEARMIAETYDDVVFICGRYEGVDARVNEILDVVEYSVGPYVLTGGELPALTMLDAIVRQVPGALGDPESLEHARIAPKDTYTRPEVFEWKGKSYSVPDILLSGHHQNVDEFRAQGGSTQEE